MNVVVRKPGMDWIDLNSNVSVMLSLNLFLFSSQVSTATYNPFVPTICDYTGHMISISCVLQFSKHSMLHCWQSVYV